MLTMDFIIGEKEEQTKNWLHNGLIIDKLQRKIIKEKRNLQKESIKNLIQ